MIKLDYKTERIRKEMESGNVKLRLVNILMWGMEFISIQFPFYKNLIITDIFRTSKEQDKIYLNHSNSSIVKKYKKKPFLSVHQFWRGIDIRCNDMPTGMAMEITSMFNQIQYDPKRPKKKTAILHDVGTGIHIHLQVMT